MKRISPPRITDLISAIGKADAAPQRALEAEEKLKILGDPASIKRLLPLLARKYPPSQATDAAIRVLRSLDADEQGSDYLAGKLKDPRPRVRAAAATVLESFPNLRAVPALTIASNDRNVDVRIGAIHTIWIWSLQFPSLKRTIFDVCKRSVRHESHGVRGAAFECLSHIPDTRSKKLLALAATDRHKQIREMAPAWLKLTKRKDEVG